MADNGEGPSSDPQFNATMTQRFRSSAPMAFDSVDTATTGPPIDTLMDDVSGSDNAHTETDYEYDSHRSVTPEYEECPEESSYEVHDFNGRHINVPIDMGEAIATAFPVDMDSDYDINDERNTFDDGLEDDDSEDSDASTSYEELTEPDIRLRVVDVPREDEEKDLSHSDDSADETYVHTSEEESEEEVEEGEIPGDAEESSNTPLVARVIQVPVSKSLDELQKAVIGQKRLEEVRDHRLWQLAELQEALRHIQSQIPQAEEDIQAAEASLIARQTDSIANIVASGISTELFQAYEDFCEDLHPEYGLRDGFSILCDQAHFGSYYGYDPVFQIFKDNVETDYETCNFRCEAKLERNENIIEFWPIQCPEPRTGSEITWGQQYPELFRLAIQAARAGSDAAMEMLLRLPDMDSSFQGWLFEYKFEPLLENEPIVSRRWVFSRAHFIDNPVSSEEKRRILNTSVLS